MHSPLILLLFQVLANALASSTQNVTCSEPPDVPHGFVSEGSKIAEYQQGDVLRFTCETGYISGLPIKYVCRRGQWRVINKGRCYLKPCPLPEDTPNGYYQLTSGEDFVFGATIKYFCNEGYQMVSRNDIRKCLLDTWTNRVPVCESLSCDLPPVGDDKLVVSGLPDGGDAVLPDRFLRFSCKGPGTALKGSPMVICGKDGQWASPFPTCEEITCQVPLVHRHLRVIGLPPGNETVKTGHTLHFYCNNGNPLEGPEEVQCLESGQWSSPFPKCAEYCHVTHLPDNVIVNEIARFPHAARQGKRLTFRCSRHGQVLHGANSVECLANGEWSHPFPTCGAPHACGSPPPLEHGDIRETRKFLYNHNERVQYLCQQYYRMEVQPYKTCKNGEWVGEEIKCYKPCTVNSAIMTTHNIAFSHSLKDTLYAPHNDHITFSCTRGNPVDSSGMRRKCVDGEMPLPSCK
ncbi:complement factor H-related protein 1-like [Nelusetta ayraudi]|uniref:complement factor H-related protein 1-like n=1 Tax=Nelusetta ayraudi TaxID=303726 RepID=UPI003F7188C0